MRLICPHCMSGVTVPDDAAGKDATCPNCGKSFPTPSRYSAEVVPDAASAIAAGASASAHSEPVTASADRPTPPPGFVPPQAPSPPPVAPSGFLPPAHAETPTLAGYTRSRGLTLSPAVIAWLPAVLLTLTILFTAFPWVGCYAGGSAVYSQQPWRAMFGSVSRNFPLEKAVTIPKGWLDKVRSDWELMVPYLLFLILVTALAWADRGLKTLDPRKIPPLAKVWPHRQTVMLALAALTFTLSLIQVFNGFGMERAIRKQLSDEFAGRREKAVNSPAAIAQLDYEEEQEYAKFNLERTTWLYLALVCNALAVVAMLMWLILERRGNKPAPRIVLHY